MELCVCGDEGFSILRMNRPLYSFSFVNEWMDTWLSYKNRFFSRYDPFEWISHVLLIRNRQSTTDLGSVSDCWADLKFIYNLQPTGFFLVLTLSLGRIRFVVSVSGGKKRRVRENQARPHLYISLVVVVPSNKLVREVVIIKYTYIPSMNYTLLSMLAGKEQWIKNVKW